MAVAERFCVAPLTLRSALVKMRSMNSTIAHAPTVAPAKAVRDLIMSPAYANGVALNDLRGDIETMLAAMPAVGRLAITPRGKKGAALIEIYGVGEDSAVTATVTIKANGEVESLSTAEAKFA